MDEPIDEFGEPMAKEEVSLDADDGGEDDLGLSISDAEEEWN